MSNNLQNAAKATLSLGVLFVPLAAKAQVKDTKPMNILYIMSDDHSFRALSAYDNRYIDTPNIDRIAKDGALFTSSFVANSISGPSRACMLTGKHSHINGYTDNVKAKFDGDQQTFPKLLQKAGYQTAVIGKWHLTSLPQGFDHWDILIGQGHYYKPTFINNGKKVTREGYATTVTTDLALEWLDESRDKTKPFCLLLHHKAPHRSWMPEIEDLDLFKDVNFPLPDNFHDDYKGRIAASSQDMSIEKTMDLTYDLKMRDTTGTLPKSLYGNSGEFNYSRLTPEQKSIWDANYDKVLADLIAANLSGDKLTEWKYQQYMKDYLRVITSLDRNIGRVLDYLEENDMMENTLIVYTSDQGFYVGEHGWFDKRFMYEESFRTPLLMRMPGGKKGNIDHLVQNIDYAPTFLDLAGMEVPADIQGVSLLPLLKGEKCKEWRNGLYYHYYEYPGEHSVKRHYGVRTDRYKLIHFYDDIDVWELYDLKKDPNEMNNIYGTKGNEKITKELMEELIALRKQYKSTEG